MLEHPQCAGARAHRRVRIAQLLHLGQKSLVIAREPDYGRQGVDLWNPGIFLAAGFHISILRGCLIGLGLITVSEYCLITVCVLYACLGLMATGLDC